MATSNGKETKHISLRVTEDQTDTSTPYLVSRSTDGTYGKIDPLLLPVPATVFDALKLKGYLSTGLLKNGLITINADPTKFNISTGIGVISNFDDPENPTSTLINFPAFTGITPTYLLTGNITYIAVNSTPAIIMQATPFTAIQRRDIIELGAVIHSNLTNINVVNNISAPSNAIGNQLHDFIEAVGALNITGNKYSANGANLSLNKSAGTIFKFGVNFASDWKNPHQLNQPSGTALTFRYRTQNGTEGSDSTSISPGVYDNSNVITSVPNNKFSIQTIIMFQTGLTRILYGQQVYDDLATAKNAIFTRNFNIESNSKENGIVRAYMIVKNNTTSLLNTSDSEIIEAQKFGGVASGGVALTLANIVSALGYTPENTTNKQNSLATDGTGVKFPTVDGVNGGVVYKRTIAQIRALTGVLPNNYFYTTDLRQEGNWYYDDSDTTSADDTGSVLVTADGKRIKRVINDKISPLWFGCKGDSTTDDTVNFQKSMTYLGSTFTNTESSSFNAAELNRIVLDLQGKTYLINSEIILPIIQSTKPIGGFMIEGGKLMIGDGLQATSGYLFHFTDAEKIVFQNLTIQGKRDDSTNRNAFFFDGVCINVKIMNVSAIDCNQFLKTSDTSFDVTVSDSYVRTYTAPFPSVMVDVAGDAMFNNNYFIGCYTAISTRLGGNIIRGNHFYGAQGTEPLGVLCNNNSSYGTIIDNNYFDGHSVKLYAFGNNAVITGNTFPNGVAYCPIKLLPYGGTLPEKITVKDNVIMYLNAKTPVLTAVTFTYDFTLKKITLTGSETFTDKNLGAVFQNTVNQKIQIYSIIDSKNALAKTVSFFDFTTGSYAVDMNPTPVVIANDENMTTLNTRKSLFIYDNSQTIDSPAGGPFSYPVIFKGESEYYNQVTKKVDRAFTFEGAEALNFSRFSHDFRNIRFLISGVVSGTIGTTSGFLRLAQSATSGKSLLLSDSVLRSETANTISLGTTNERFSNAFLELLTLRSPATASGGYEFLVRNTSTEVVEKIASNTIAPVTSPTFITGITTPAINLSGQTASTIAILDASKNIVSASTATYPSLTELSYLKGTINSVPKFYTDSTTVALSSATLTGTYPNATIGSEVHALNITLGGMIYKKTVTGWASIAAVVTP